MGSYVCEKNKSYFLKRLNPGHMNRHQHIGANKEYTEPDWLSRPTNPYYHCCEVPWLDRKLHLDPRSRTFSPRNMLIVASVTSLGVNGRTLAYFSCPDLSAISLRSLHLPPPPSVTLPEDTPPVIFGVVRMLTTQRNPRERERER